MNSAFSDCTSITTVSIPESIEIIEKNAFHYCINLKSIDVNINNKKYKSIDGVLFTKDGKTLITYPASKEESSYIIPIDVEEIEFDAFLDCKNLKSIEIDKNNNKYKSIDGVLFTKDEKTLITYPVGKEEQTYNIPIGVEEIEIDAFSGCTSLTSINFSQTVKKIGCSAFSNCIRLVNVNFSENITEINFGAFYSCKSLTTIKLPSSIKEIECFTFWDCTNLVNISVSESLVKIGEYAFRNCTSLKNINLSKRVEVEKNAFKGCTLLK